MSVTTPPRTSHAPAGAPRSRWFVALIAALLIGTALLLAAPARAQVFSAATGTSLHVTKSSALSLVTVSGTGQSVLLTEGAITEYASPVTVKLDWNFPPNQVNSVAVVGYFAGAAGALSSGTDQIPTAWVEGRLGTTGGFAPFTQSFATPAQANSANALLLHTTGSTKSSGRRGTVTLDVYLRLNLTGRTVPNGDYNGTLVLQAFSQ